MSDNVQAKLSLAVTADIVAFRKNLETAKAATAASAKAMGTSLSDFKTNAAKQLALAGREMELLDKKNAIVRAGLEKTAQSGRTELAKVGAAYKLAKMDSESFAKQVQHDQGKVGKSFESLKNSISSIKAPLAAMAVSLAAAVSVGSVKSILELASTYNTLTQRIKTATKDTHDFNTVSQALYKVSKQNGASLADTVTVFQALARTAKELHATNTQMITLTDTIQKLGVIGGSSATAMSDGLRQLSQSFAGGIVRAEEWHSVVENMPEVAHRIATGMSLSDGEINKLMLSGKLLSKDVMASLLNQSAQIAEEFDKMPRSIQQGYESLATSVGLVVSQIDKITGATQSAVAMMDALGESFSRIGENSAAFSGGMDSRVQYGKKTASLGQLAGASAKTLPESVSNRAADAGDNLWRLMSFGVGMSAKDQAERKRQRDSSLDKNFRLAATGTLDEFDMPDYADSEGHAAAPKIKKASTGDGKAEKKHAKDIQRADDMLASMRAQNVELEAKLNKDDAAVTQEKALLKLSKDRTLTEKERNGYAVEINKLAARHAELIKQEAIQKEQEKLSSILAGHRQKIALLKNELESNKENNALLAAEKQIQDTVKVGMAETAKARQEILEAAKEEAVLHDAVKLKEIEESYKQQLESSKAKVNYAKELIPIIEAEKKIRDAITAGLGENEAAQKRIRDLAKEMSDVILKQQFEAESKKLDKVGESLADENEKLKQKLLGQENLAKFLDVERDLRKQIAEYVAEEAKHLQEIKNNSGLNDDEKAGQVSKVKSGYEALRAQATEKIASTKTWADENIKLNAALTKQDEILQNIKDSAGSYKSKLAELDLAYKNGSITQKQWSKTAEELWKTQVKTNTTIGDAVKTMGTSMVQAIANGTKLTEVFKSMGKQLAVLAAQKLVFEPLARGLDSIASKMFGTGKNTPKPVMPGTSGQGPYTASGGAGGGGSLGGGLANDPIGLANALGIPGHEDGGWYDSGPMLVGERGPEIMWPSNGGYMQNNAGTRGSATRNNPRLESLLAQQRELGRPGGGKWDNYTNGDLNAQINAEYKRTFSLDGDNGRFGQELRRIVDQTAMAEARGRLEAAQRGEMVLNMSAQGYLNSFAAVKDGSISTQGAGAEQAYQVGMGNGNQQYNELMRSKSLGVHVSDSMLQFGKDTDTRFDEGQSTQAIKADRWMSSSYKSQGIAGGDTALSVDGGDYSAAQNNAWDFFHKGKQVGYDGLSNDQMWRTFHGSGYQRARGFVGGPLTGGNIKDWSAANYGQGTGMTDWTKNQGGPGVTEWDMPPMPRDYSKDQLEYLSPALVQRRGSEKQIAQQLGSNREKQWADELRKRQSTADKNGAGYGSGYFPEDGSKFPGSNYKGNGPNRVFDGQNPGSNNNSQNPDYNAVLDDPALVKAMGRGGKYAKATGPAGSWGTLEPDEATLRAGNDLDHERQLFYEANPKYFSMSDKQIRKAIKTNSFNPPAKQQYDSFSDDKPIGLNDGTKPKTFGILNPIFGGAAGAPGRLSKTQSGATNPSYDVFSDTTHSNNFDRNNFNPMAAGAVEAGMGYDRNKPTSGWAVNRGKRGYASGGTVRGGELALVGEHGPELIRPAAASQVLPNGSSAGPATAQAVITVNNHAGVQVQTTPRAGGGAEINIFKMMAMQVDENQTLGRSIGRQNRRFPR